MYIPFRSNNCYDNSLNMLLVSKASWIKWGDSFAVALVSIEFLFPGFRWRGGVFGDSINDIIRSRSHLHRQGSSWQASIPAARCLKARVDGGGPVSKDDAFAPGAHMVIYPDATCHEPLCIVLRSYDTGCL